MERNNDNYIIASEFQILKLLIDNPTINIKDLCLDSFPHSQARSIYLSINKLQEKEEEINEISLFREANKTDPTVDLSLISSLMSYKVDLSNLTSALEDMKVGSVKYELSKFALKLQEITSSHDDIDQAEISGLISQAHDTLLSGNTRSVAKSLEECLNDYEEELSLRKLGHYYQFNDPFLDSMLTKKAAPGQVILISGSTGTGKSAYTLNLIKGMISNNTPCMYFSLEMDEVSTFDRYLAISTGIPISEWYTSGQSIDPLIAIVNKQKSEVIGKPFKFIDSPTITLDEIEHLVREFKLQYKTDYACIYIDLITQVKDFIDMKNSKGTLATTIEVAVNRLNAIAKKENVCIVAVAQMNREADSAKIDSIDDISKLRPSINNIKNSNALGERSRVVLSVFRSKYYAERLFPEDEALEFMEDILEIQLLKQSMGGVGMIGRYNYNGPTCACNVLKE